MKTPSLNIIFGAIVFASTLVSLYGTTVTLGVNSDPSAGSAVATCSISIATNQVATVAAMSNRSGPAGSYAVAQWIKNGTTNTFGFRHPTMPVIAGPALIVLDTQGQRLVSAFCILKIEGEPSPPAQTLTLPAGTSALVCVQASPDLLSWTNAVTLGYTNVPGNLFFRIRAQLQ
jgi:hypothetical protein